MTEGMPFLQKYDITFLRPPTILAGGLLIPDRLELRNGSGYQVANKAI